MPYLDDFIAGVILAFIFFVLFRAYVYPRTANKILRESPSFPYKKEATAKAVLERRGYCPISERYHSYLDVIEKDGFQWKNDLRCSEFKDHAEQSFAENFQRLREGRF